MKKQTRKQNKRKEFFEPVKVFFALLFVFFFSFFFPAAFPQSKAADNKLIDTIPALNPFAHTADACPFKCVECEI